MPATTNTLMTPTTGYTPNNGDWVLLDKGFCDLLYDGYDRMAIAVVELDGGLWVPTEEVPQTDLGSVPLDKRQWARDTFNTDRWVKSTIKPSDFDGDNEVYLIRLGTNFVVSQSPPGNAYPWVLLQRF
jgi:hypothetical protein